MCATASSGLAHNLSRPGASVIIRRHGDWRVGGVSVACALAPGPPAGGTNLAKVGCAAAPNDPRHPYGYPGAALCVPGEAPDRRSQVAVDRAVVRDEHTSAGDRRVRQVGAG
jgi:hypothetical protein